MNIKDVEKQIESIQKLDDCGDFEAAHGLEDGLMLDFISLVAGQDNEHSDTQVIAEMILKFIEESDALRYTA